MKILRLAFMNLLRYKRRTLLTGLLIAVGGDGDRFRRPR
jgi:hypothetical protein